MQKLFILLSLIILSGVACKKDHDHICDCLLPYQIYYLKAAVIETRNLDCGRPLLDFTEDSARIHLTTGIKQEKFIMTSLDPSLNVLNKKLYVSVKMTGSEDYFACTTLGPSYPGLKLLDAKPRE